MKIFVEDIMMSTDQTDFGFELRRFKLACGAQALGAVIKGFVARWAAYRQARRERAQLLALGDRELRDIGISRVDAVHEATKPVRWP
jgi:uncharacterized protein YjiS (DUF1127 family)